MQEMFAFITITVYYYHLWHEWYFIQFIGANVIYILECARFHKHCTFILNRDYRAEYEKLKAEKKQKERSRQKDQMSRLQNDVNLGGQGDMEGT